MGTYLIKYLLGAVVAVIVLLLVYGLGYLKATAVHEATLKQQQEAIYAYENQIQEDASTFAYNSDDATIRAELDRVFGEEDRVQACRKMCPDTVRPKERFGKQQVQEVDSVVSEVADWSWLPSYKQKGAKPTHTWSTESDDPLEDYVRPDGAEAPKWAKPKGLIERAIKEFM